MLEQERRHEAQMRELTQQHEAALSELSERQRSFDNVKRSDSSADKNAIKELKAQLAKLAQKSEEQVLSIRGKEATIEGLRADLTKLRAEMSKTLDDHDVAATANLAASLAPLEKLAADYKRYDLRLFHSLW